MVNPAARSETHRVPEGYNLKNSSNSKWYQRNISYELSGGSNEPYIRIYSETGLKRFLNYVASKIFHAKEHFFSKPIEVEVLPNELACIKNESESGWFIGKLIEESKKCELTANNVHNIWKSSLNHNQPTNVQTKRVATEYTQKEFDSVKNKTEAPEFKLFIK